ncbi:MAG: hypothetical protein ACR2GU_02010 [Rubrobacteraceae bacterium]
MNEKTKVMENASGAESRKGRNAWIDGPEVAVALASYLVLQIIGGARGEQRAHLRAGTGVG